LFSFTCTEFCILISLNTYNFVQLGSGLGFICFPLINLAFAGEDRAMAEVAAGLLTNAVIKIAVRKLGYAIVEQGNLAWNFSDHLADLKDIMESIAVVVKDAEKKLVETERARLWLKRLKNAAQGISDMMDDYQDQMAEQVRKLLQAIDNTFIYSPLSSDEQELHIYIRNSLYLRLHQTNTPSIPKYLSPLTFSATLIILSY
jgi:hypothetical protein